MGAVSAAFHFNYMTPVQAATIPVFRTGTRDVAVQACTGSGKTLAFVVPVIEMLLRRSWRPSQIGAVILAPTRELARQIFGVVQALLEHVPPGLGAVLLIGGSGTITDQRTSDSVNVIIATPGRLEETLRTPAPQYDVRDLDVLILDEADRLLDLGFDVSLRNILARLPRQRRTGLFSATQTTEVEALVRAGLRNPTRIDVQVRPSSSSSSTATTPSTLSSAYVTVEPDAKLAHLVDLLRTSSQPKIVVFVLTCAGAEYFGALLPHLVSGQRRRIRSLHGRMAQSARDRVLGEFRDDHDPTALVCTDVLARGIDVPDVDLIVQYDAPQDPAVFVHRVGRTARAGRTGCALLYLLPGEGEYVDLLAARGVPVQPDTISTAVDADAFVEHVRALALTDRDLVEKGQRAFVAFVRGYKEHHCAYIFQLKRVSLPLLARGLGLVQLPRMPELKGARDADAFGVVAGLEDLDAIPYRDKGREKQRQAHLADKQAARAAAKVERQRQRKVAESRQKLAVKARRKRKQSATQDRQAEWDELDHEVKSYRMLKKGRITMKEFEIAVGERARPDHDD